MNDVLIKTSECCVARRNACIPSAVKKCGLLMREHVYGVFNVWTAETASDIVETMNENWLSIVPSSASHSDLAHILVYHFTTGPGVPTGNGSVTVTVTVTVDSGPLGQGSDIVL